MAQGLGYKCLRNTFMPYKMSAFMSPHMFDRSLDFQGIMEDAKFLALIHTITKQIPLLSEIEDQAKSLKQPKDKDITPNHHALA